MRVRVHFLDYWHAGTGRGSRYHLDALVVRDPDGLPYLPGRTLRGLLRDAVQRLEAWGRIPWPNAAITLFGAEDRPGCLHLSNAVLPEELRAWLAAPESVAERRALFRSHFATAITPQGVAKEKSLRGMEVCVPMTLEAELCPLPYAEAPAWWQEAIRRAAFLVRAAGAHRTRGFGRCWLEVVVDA